MDDFNLEDVRIASPCKASWRKMKGDDRVRNCAKCSLNVYNISEMTREEAAELIANTEGRLCIRLWRRRDGTVITKDCPMGFRQLRYGIAVCASIILGVILATMQWTRLFTNQEMELLEKKKDLQAGMAAYGRIIVAKRYLFAGHRIDREDLHEMEVDYRKIPINAVAYADQIVGKTLLKDVGWETVLTMRDVSEDDSNVIFNGDRLGVDLDLNPKEIDEINNMAKAKKTSVSQLMRKWISKRIKSYGRD